MSFAIPLWWSMIQHTAERSYDIPRAVLLIESQVVGSIALPLLSSMCQADLPLIVGHDSAQAFLHGEASDALRDIADWLHAHEHAGRWRDELLSVRSGEDGPILAVVERGVARNLGIHTWAVQLHARDPQSNRWWLQQRALDKATDPGKWDTVTGGLVAAGESISQALERETWEEAGVRLVDLATAPRKAGSFTVRRPVQDAGTHGHMVETVFAFACTLDAGQVPVNQDGEVMRFEAFSDAQIDILIAAGELTLEAAVAIALCRGVRA